MQFWKRPHGPEQLRSYTDEALCREVLQGNQEAFLVLFDRYWLDVFRLAHSVLRNDAAAEDLIQDLFLEVHTTMLRYDEQRGAFRTLLLRYAYTRAIDHRRQLESRRYYVMEQIEEIEELEPEVFSRDISLSSGLSIEEGTRLIEQGLEYLEDKQRATVTAYFFQGLSVHEIAAEMGESAGNTRHHLYRGLDRMRKLLAPKEEGGETAEPESPVTLRLHRRLPKRVGQEVSLVRARSI
jgi:RNA polymerase sigma-70 factor (ECF subfamily)